MSYLYYRNSSSYAPANYTSDSPNARYRPRPSQAHQSTDNPGRHVLEYRTRHTGTSDYREVVNSSCAELSKGYPKLMDRYYKNALASKRVLRSGLEDLGGGKGNGKELRMSGEKLGEDAEGYRLKSIKELVEDLIEIKLLKVKEEIASRVKMENNANETVQLERLKRNIKEAEENIEEQNRNMRKFVEENKKSIGEIKRKQKVQEVVLKKHIEEINKKLAESEGHKDGGEWMQNLNDNISTLNKKHATLEQNVNKFFNDLSKMKEQQAIDTKSRIPSVQNVANKCLEEVKKQTIEYLGNKYKQELNILNSKNKEYANELKARLLELDNECKGCMKKLESKHADVYKNLQLKLNKMLEEKTSNTKSEHKVEARSELVQMKQQILLHLEKLSEELKSSRKEILSKIAAHSRSYQTDNLSKDTRRLQWFALGKNRAVKARSLSTDSKDFKQNKSPSVNSKEFKLDEEFANSFSGSSGRAKEFHESSEQEEDKELIKLVKSMLINSTQKLNTNQLWEKVEEKASPKEIKDFASLDNIESERESSSFYSARNSDG
eukprot:TRINITY_DN9335_c0_g3_i1.p1 TRINITY_DN9335_c0_g3~~TRINITY_DN9335_c0_g3_i1.p1  ORF type:complete len:550 (+),score=106.29 TRINITY_DN9335_c0_g3_i1:83-1732(+)